MFSLPSLSFGQATSNKNVESFELLCQVFSEGYASFPEKNIDWPEVCANYRPLVSNNISDDSLYAIFTEMLTPLNDAHVSLHSKNPARRFSAARSSRIMDALESIPKVQRKAKFYQMADATLSQQGFNPIKQVGPSFKKEKLFSYTQNGKIGYLRYTRSFSTLKHMVGKNLNHQVKHIMDQLNEVDALIIDLRFNIGGDDDFSKTIAGHFTDKPLLVYYKQTRSHSQYDSLQAHYLLPMGNTAFTKPVIVLTNDRTVSAADVMTLMMAQLPHITIMGEASNGSYSDMTSTVLPNGWEVSLSNQRYLSPEMVNYEGIGYPVALTAQNTLADFKQNQDSVLLKAIAVLVEMSTN